MTQNLNDLKLGFIISQLRCGKNLTLQDLATKTGIEKKMLSDIESGEIVPPVATLITIAKSLGVGMSYFFKEQEAVEQINVTRADERSKLGRRPHHHAGEVDYSYEILTNKRIRNMEPLLVEFKPMNISDMVFVNHEGEEFLYILEGALEFRTDTRAEILRPGDSLYFDSSVSHSARALEDKTARAVVVVWSKP